MVYKLQVVVEKAYNLPISDPYCKVRLVSKPDEKYRSKVIKNTFDPVWDFSVEIPIDSKDVNNEFVEFRLFGNVWRNGFIDSVQLPLNRLVKGQTVKKVFKVKGSKNLIGTLHVELTAVDFGREAKTSSEKMESISKRMNFNKAFQVFGVTPSSSIVQDYFLLRDRMHEWRERDFTIENVATLTFHSYDKDHKGYLSQSDVTKIADHMFSTGIPSNIRSANIKRQLEKWQKHSTDETRYSADEFQSLLSDLLKEEQFINKTAIVKIGERSQAEKFKEELLAFISIVGLESANDRTSLVMLDLFDINTNESAMLKPFNTPAIITPQKRPSFLGNLAQAFFEYYHQTCIDDEQLDNVLNWRLTLIDFKDFFKETKNKLKNIKPKEAYDSYSLQDFKTEFLKVTDEFSFDQE